MEKENTAQNPKSAAAGAEARRETAAAANLGKFKSVDALLNAYNSLEVGGAGARGKGRARKGRNGERRTRRIFGFARAFTTRRSGIAARRGSSFRRRTCRKNQKNRRGILRRAGNTDAAVRGDAGERTTGACADHARGGRQLFRRARAARALVRGGGQTRGGSVW